MDVTGYFEIEVENGTVTEMFIMDVTIDGTSITSETTDLFFSEYGEGGSGNNKWLEIFNGTGETVDLTGYSVKLASNGGEWSNTLNLSGTLADGEVLVIYNSGADAPILEAGDVSSDVTYFNGNDAVALFKDDVIIDLIGIYQDDPGKTVGWPAGDDGSTVDHTLVRKGSVLSPNATFTASEWEVFPDMTFTEVGSHSVDVIELTDDVKVLVDKAELDLGGVIVSETAITLPTAGTLGSVITWTIKTDAGSNATLVGNALTLNAVETDAVVVIEATLTIGDTTPVTEKSVFTYYLQGSTAAERVAADLAELVDAELDQDLYVAADVDLPTMGSFGSAITWEITTDDDLMATLDEAGDTVSFLNATLAETTVTLTATVAYGTESDTMTVTFTLKAYPIVNLEDFTTKSDGDIVVVTGYVYAIIDSGFFVQDATGKVFVDTYGSSASYNVGDEVFLTGEVDIYNGFYKLSNLIEAPVASTTGNDVTQTAVEYVPGTTTPEFGETYTIQGTVAIEGDHNNVFIYLNATDKIEIYYQSPDASIDALEALVGKEIIVDVIFYDGTRFAFVGNTNDVLVITSVTDFSDFNTKTDGTNYDLAVGDLVKVTGVVTANTYDGLFIQDGNGLGFFLYKPDETGVNIGDEVVYFAEIGTFNNVRQLYDGVLLEIVSSSNTIVPTVLSADQMIALDPEDAGLLISFTGFEIVEYDGSHVTFKVTGTTESREFVHRYYTNFADWLPDVFEVGDVLPEVQFVLYNFYSLTSPNIDALDIEFTDALKLEADRNAFSSELSLSADYLLPTGDNGSSFEVTVVSTELSSYLDVTTTPGTILVTQPAIGELDVTGTITVEASLGTETPITFTVDVTVKAEVEAGTQTIVTAAYTDTTTTTNMVDGNNAAIIGLDPAIFNVVSTPRVVIPLHVGLNKAGQIRLYNSTDGQGNILTISIDSAYTITNVKFEFGTTVSTAKIITGTTEQFNGALTASGTLTYSGLDVSVFSIQNIGTAQIYILSIEITYEPV
jgi:hypothetical protein